MVTETINMQEISVVSLSYEIERVIATRYTPSLHNLDRIVENASYGSLRQWATCKPCQVSLLAAVVLEQLPHTIKLLTSFGYIREFRDALLDREPALLDQLLLRATADGNDENFNACVAMLSCPVPRDVAVPARGPVFLTKLLSKLVGNPCAGTIRPLYEVMEGLLSHSEIIQLLPNDLMENFQLEGTKILRNMDDPLGTLLTLATFARIHRLWQPVSQKASEERSREPQWLGNIYQIFGPQKAPKTLDLVIISAVMACSNSSNPSNQFTVKHRVLMVELAIEICREIDEELKKPWVSSNCAKLLKLCDKLRRPEIDGELQLMGLALLINFSKWLSLPAEFYQMMRNKIFMDTKCNTIDGLAEREREILIQRLLLEMQSCKNPDTDSLSKIKTSVLLLTVMRNSHNHLLVGDSYLRRLHVEATKKLRASVQDFQSRNKQFQCEGSVLCYGALNSWKDRLLLEFLSLRTSETTENRSGGSLQLNEMLESFLELLKHHAIKSNCCYYSTLKNLSRVDGLVYNKSKKLAKENFDGPSREWRTQVASLLLDNAQASHETILRQIEAISHDFDARCTKVEEPLKVAIHERDELRQRLEDSTQRNLKLEEQARQTTELVNTLKKQLMESMQQANNYSFQVEHLTDQLDALQNELEDTRRHSSECIDVVRSKARDRELDLMATVAERDDLLEEQQLEIEVIFKEKMQFEKNLKTVSESNRALVSERYALQQNIARLEKDALQEHDLLHHEMIQLQQVMEIRESTNAENHNRIITLSNTNQDLHCEHQIIIEKLEQEKSNSEKLMASLEEARQNYHKSITDMETRIAEQISQAHKQAQQMKERHSLEVAGLHRDAAALTAKFAEDLRVKEKRLQYLEKKVESLRNERAAKAREFSEAQEHIIRLMSIMEFSKDGTTPKSGGRELRRSSHLSELYTQTCVSTQQGEMNNNTGIQSQFLAAVPPLHVARMGRRSHGISDGIVSCFANDSSSPLLSGQKDPRRPLGNIDRNSPVKSSPPIPLKQPNHANKNSQTCAINTQDPIDMTELGGVDLDFDGQDVITSTALR